MTARGRYRDLISFSGVLSIFLVCFSAEAEYVVYPNQYYPSYSNYDDDQIQVFDDKVFNLEKKAPPEQDRHGRTVDYSASYSLQQRNKWIKQCERLKTEDYEEFKKCFQKHVAANEAAGDPYGR